MLAALRLQIEWGADEALEDAPVCRVAVRIAQPMPEARMLAQDAPPSPFSIPTMAPVQRAVERAEHAAQAANSLDELQAALANFDGCNLAATATSLVFSDGNPESGLMLIGEGPGAEEDRAGRPFVGPAGLLLDRMLASIGIDRTHCLMTNLIAWRPPGNRNPTDNEVALCLPFLLRHIALVQPKRLVLFGAVASHALLGTKAGITRLRGRWTEVAVPGLEAPVRAMPMQHPLTLLRNSAAKRDAWSDMIALRRDLDDLK